MITTDYSEIAKRSRYNKLKIVELLDTYETISKKELTKYIPIKFLKSELTILEYYSIVEVGENIMKGKNFGIMGTHDLPSVSMLTIDPLIKVTYELLKSVECYTVNDIHYYLNLYGLKISYPTMYRKLKVLLRGGIVTKEKLWGHIHLYRVNYDLFITPPTFEEKLQEAYDYCKKWDHMRKYPMGGEEANDR